MRSQLIASLLAASLFLSAHAQTPPQQPKLLVEDALLFTMAPAQRKPFLGYFTVATDGTILTIAAGTPPPQLNAHRVIDAHGHWIIPGFISAHSHLWQAPFRGLAADSTLTGWLTAVYNDSGNKARPEDLYWFTLDGALDHLQHGITAAYSFDYGGASVCHPSPDVAHTCDGYTFQAEMDSGIRFVHGYDDGQATAPGITPAYTAAQARLPLKAFLDYAQQASIKAGTRQYLSTMISGYAAFSNTENQAYLDKALMQEFHLANQSHYLEPPESAAEEQAKFHWFTDSGLLGPNLIFGHFIHTTPVIIAATGKAGAAMSWQPLSNGRLASGVPDIPAYLKAGIRVGMGVDGEASADLADPFENMRTGLYAIRDKYESATIMSPYDVLRLHTMGSADVLNVANKLGSLEPGKLADFLIIDPTSFGPVSDPYASLVFIASEPDLEGVFVGGTQLVSNGKLLNADIHRVDAEVALRVARIRATN
ncbi:amidohydrolase family protein [Granulicella sp. 5B5]|uniref:amidohydrolase family protein n=1 Tax=Granulicella sp. 5B5 TaxID=1617967 RepID=UPI0015F4540E|nr:amidohydrolase family protein [Granulicella sp. 5B5]QMV19389.1 amidohydrolase family protein [Granulicella sp. 5B5]